MLSVMERLAATVHDRREKASGSGLLPLYSDGLEVVQQACPKCQENTAEPILMCVFFSNNMTGRRRRKSSKSGVLLLLRPNFPPGVWCPKISWLLESSVSPLITTLNPF